MRPVGPTCASPRSTRVPLASCTTIASEGASTRSPNTIDISPGALCTVPLAGGLVRTGDACGSADVALSSKAASAKGISRRRPVMMDLGLVGGDQTGTSMTERHGKAAHNAPRRRRLNAIDLFDHWDASGDVA